jgi:biotin carboxylase
LVLLSGAECRAGGSDLTLSFVVRRSSFVVRRFGVLAIEGCRTANVERRTSNRERRTENVEGRTENVVSRVLILAATTGYQTRSFGEAAERLGVELVFATDRCHLIEDPWQDQAIPIRFHDEDASVAAIVEAATVRRIDGVLAVGDRPTVIAARVAQALGLAGHPPEAASVARDKQRTRERLRDAGLPVPWFFSVAISHPASAPSETDGASARLAGAAEPRRRQPSAIDGVRPPLSYPCVVKPVALSGSRGVMRADDPASFATAYERLRALLRSPEVRAERNQVHETALVEGFIPGREYAVEALLHHGMLHVLAIFDKPEPLDGPFFEETIYVTPSSAPADVQDRIIQAVTSTAKAIGLHHGPVHAECRVNEQGVFVLEVAARPIGGLCARALRFQSAISNQQSAMP